MKLVFFLDVDDTLLDSQGLIREFRDHVKRELGSTGAKRYWTIVKRLQSKRGYPDYFAAIQHYRLRELCESRLLSVSRFLLEYPFEKRLFPSALKIIHKIKRTGGIPVLFSDGDVVFQALKIGKSGLMHATGDNALICVNKVQEMATALKLYTAKRVVVVDDEPKILSAIKKKWKTRAITVLLTEKDRSSQENATGKPPPDFVLSNIGALFTCDFTG